MRTGQLHGFEEGAISHAIYTTAWDGDTVIDASVSGEFTVDSLRHTFATLLSRGGTTPRVAQAAMRHSTIELTMNTYADPLLLDMAGALDVLPSLPLRAPTTST